MILETSVLTWLDAHSAAVTAIATVFLVAITAAYVVVTYLLVREQRLQGDTPKVEHELATRHRGAVAGASARVELRLQNVGTGTASELTILGGPKESISVDMPALGERMTLLAGDATTWLIRPPAGGEFPSGDLSLTMTYTDNLRTKVVFEVFVLQFKSDVNGWAVRNLGSVTVTWTRRSLRRDARRSIPRWRRLPFRVRMRKHSISRLLTEDDVRRAVRTELNAAADQLVEFDAKMTETRARI